VSNTREQKMSRPIQISPGHRASILIAAIAALALVLSAQQAPATDSQSALTPASAQASKAIFKPTTLADISWLQGQWSGVWGPRIATQSWSAPRAGIMLGTLQIVEDTKTLVLEFVAITETPQGLQYRLLHFTPALDAWENGGPATLSLMSTDSRKFVFQNQTDGEPQQIVLLRGDPDTYTDRSEILPETGEPQATEIVFHRQKLSAGNAAHR
jgi:hypothetical protein